MTSEFDRKQKEMNDNRIQELEVCLCVANTKIVQLEHDMKVLGGNTVIICYCKQEKMEILHKNDTNSTIIYKVNYCTRCKIGNMCTKLCCIFNCFKCPR